MTCTEGATRTSTRFSELKTMCERSLASRKPCLFGLASVFATICAAASADTVICFMRRPIIDPWILSACPLDYALLGPSGIRLHGQCRSLQAAVGDPDHVPGSRAFRFTGTAGGVKNVLLPDERHPHCSQETGVDEKTNCSPVARVAVL